MIFFLQRSSSTVVGAVREKQTG